MKEITTQVVGVVGAGTMGRGIVQLFAQAGHDVYLFDVAPGAVEQGLTSVESMVDKLLKKQRLSEEAAQAVKGRLHACSELADLSVCDLVIEAIVENITVKRSVFKDLESVVAPTAVLASNTSSLLVADIAAECEYPERVAGLHFFNPVPLMKVAEVISAVRTAPETVVTLTQIVEGAGHRAVVAQDQPGFLVNHAGRGLYTEGLRLLEENVTTAQGVDSILREAAGFRMGPFELLDLTGLDVSGKVMESIYEQFQQDQMFRPSSLVAPRIAAGLFGRKTSTGWYNYEDGKKIEAARATYAKPERIPSVWIDPQASQFEALSQLLKAAGATLVSEAVADSLLLIQPWGIDASQYCADHNLDASRCVAIDPLPDLNKQRTLMTTLLTLAEYRDVAYALLSQGDTPVWVINDSPGFVMQRVLAVVVNIAPNIAQRRIAKVVDIEDAVKLGLGYPKGPLSWGDEMGADKVLAILDGLYRVTRDPRYRPSPWLRRRAQLNVSLCVEESGACS